MANLLLVKDTKWEESLVSDGQLAFIAQDTDEGKNILYAQGEYFGDSAKSNKVSIKEKIVVAGGPLAESVSEVYPDGIAEGTTLQEILVSLLCKELFPDVKVQEPTAGLKSGTIYFNSVPSGFIEVGTISEIKATPTATTSTTRAAKISEMTHGYVQNGVKSENTSISENVEVSLFGDYTFEMTSTSFSNNAGVDVDDTITTTNSEISSCVINTYAKTKFGPNTINATLTNIEGSFSVDSIEDIVPLSNLGNEGETSYSTSYFSDEPLYAPANATTTKTWTGAYPIYFNGVEYADQNADGAEIGSTSVTSDIALTKCKTLNTSITKYIKFPNQAASNGWKIAIPDAYPNTVITAKAFNATSAKYNAPKTFTKGSTIGSGTCGVDTTFAYTLYECKGTDGENGLYVTITLK